MHEKFYRVKMHIRRLSRYRQTRDEEGKEKKRRMDLNILAGIYEKLPMHLPISVYNVEKSYVM